MSDSGTDVLLLEDLSLQRLPARTLAAQLAGAGLRVRLVGFGGQEDGAAVVGLALAERPRLVVSSILFAGLVSEHLALATAAKADGLAAHWTMVGPLPSFVYRALLEACPALDSILRGEAEVGIVRLAAGVGVPRSTLAAVPGLAYRAQGGIICSPSGPAVALDGLPFPWRGDGLPAFGGHGFATLETSRGCYHACSFCLPCAANRDSGAPAYRQRSVASVADEMEALYRQGARLFLFDDEQFLPPPGERAARVMALEREWRRRGLTAAFTIKCRPDDVEPSLFAQLKEMGLLRVYVGVESGCQATLDRLGKGLRAEQGLHALETLHSLGIVADFRALVFHPWSTLASLAGECDFLTRALPVLSTCLDFAELEVYAGTPIARQLPRRDGVLSPHWLIPYAAADSRAEVLRRLTRLVFPRAGSYYAQVKADVAAAWFALLLECRFAPRAGPERERRALEATVRRLNGEILAVWREMISFVSSTAGCAKAAMNDRAAAWRAQVDLRCAGVGRELQSASCLA